MKDVEFSGMDVKWPAVPWLELWQGGRNSVYSQVFEAAFFHPLNKLWYFGLMRR